MIRVKFLNPSVSVLVPGSTKTHHTADKYLDNHAVSANITVTLFNESSLENSESNVQKFKGVKQFKEVTLDEKNFGLFLGTG